MNKRILRVLITTLTVAAIGQGTMNLVGMIINEHQDQQLRRGGHIKVRRREDFSFIK